MSPSGWSDSSSGWRQLHWLRLPHWATGFGWLALSLYFAFYLPVFVGLARVAVHRLRVPVILAAPVVWTGLELVRAHLLTGMTMASLGHTQYRWIGLIQISDLAGAFAVSFLVMFVAACVARMLPCDGRRWTLWPIAPALAVVAATLTYGHWRVAGTLADGTRSVPATVGPRVALIQGSVDTRMRDDDERQEIIFRQYVRLSAQASKEYGPVDLMVWPETMFAETLVTADDDAERPREWTNTTDSEFLEALEKAVRRSPKLMSTTARAFGTDMILGVDRQHYMADGVRYYNAAVHVSADGRILGRYEKMHLVMFGEYVPYAWLCPWLQRLTPLSVSVTAGEEPAVFQVGQYRFAPNICYESVLSHVIRATGQRRSMREGESPDVLVNLTNDGWFWGSSELDMHLVCGGLPGGGMPEAAADRGQHGHLGVDRRRRPDPCPMPEARRRHSSGGRQPRLAAELVSRARRPAGRPLSGRLRAAGAGGRLGPQA